ncbi:PRC-barrel domain containing protein [Pedobacter changchengzhani]|uniref:PRC-barrel domain containing protein n=1 Tax=Pedobacter changchengzhani TaxID=2529274 RepID=A0A4R5MMG6_9SPHI|nr:PRC-barrel domain-containing protein [Pedobacter changchengzhani]TDG36475.1 PRC-barrel domain containing protein [Pedobacter changchengzhani]
MKRNIKSLIGFTMGATDGEIGEVKDFYFDDHSWTVRYLIVETGSWLNNRRVLISPEALLTPDWENKVFPVNLSKEKVKNSPNVDTENPVSRQHEIEMYNYYPWTSYWGTGIWGGGMGVTGMMTEASEPFEDAVKREVNKDIKEVGAVDPHLRSTNMVAGYTIHATDGKIGDVDDFIVDDTSWKLDFFEVDTGDWFPGKKVLISPKLIKKISWDSSEVILRISVENVKNSPEYVPNKGVEEKYVGDLHNYYAKFTVG